MKKVLIINILVIIVYMMGIVVNAESGNSFKVSTTPSNSALKPGEEVTILINVSDIYMGENGINTLEGEVEYDKDIFEEVKSSSIQSHNNWTITYNDESSTLNGKFLAVNLTSGTKEDTKIFSIKFKVKENISKTTKTQISFKDITSNNGTDLVNAGTKNVNITINVDEVVKEEKKEEKINTTKVDETQSKVTIPKTGISPVILGVLLITIIMFIVLGVKNHKMKDIK